MSTKILSITSYTREELIAELARREVVDTVEASIEDSEPMTQSEAIAEVIDFLWDDGYQLRDEMIEALNEMKTQL